MTRLMIVTIIFLILTAPVMAQTYVGGGFEVGGNSVNFKDRSRIGGVTFRPGQNIDRYAFFGGFAEAQYDYRINDRFHLNGRGLLELSTDPKNLGPQFGRSGGRFHARPEVE